MLTRRDFIGSFATGSMASGALGVGSLFASAALEGSLLLPQQAFAVEASDESSELKGIAPFATPYVTTRAELNTEPKRLLIVVDYQNDFVDGGVFGRIDPAVAVENAIYNRVKDYQDRGDIVIYTMDTHPSDVYEDTREGQFNPPHCIPGTDGWEIYGKVHELLTPEKAIRVMKGTYGSPDLPFVIKNILSQGVRLEYIEFAGVSTTCRVLHNAIIVFNFFPELPIVFDETTTASYTDERTAEQLDELEAWGFFVKRRK